MPKCIVLQPNGKYAIWSSVVDDFTGFDYTRDELLQDHELRDIDKQIENITGSGISWDWADTWSGCVRWVEKHGDSHESLEVIDNLQLPRRMKNTVSPYACEHYWHMYWRARCEALSYETRNRHLR